MKKLFAILNKLVSAGNTLVVVEHNMDAIKCANWIIDLGPKGGQQADTSWQKDDRNKWRNLPIRIQGDS
jgi:hypothetical protein